MSDTKTTRKKRTVNRKSGVKASGGARTRNPKTDTKKAPKKPASSRKPKTPSKEPKAKGDKKKTPRVNTGYMTLLRKMNGEAGKKGHSKFTVGEVWKAASKEFPEKSKKSVKRIAYNLARITGVKWAASAVVNTGYMNRIDEMLDKGKMTTRQIGEAVSFEFEKDPKKAKAVVRARLAVRIGKGDKLSPPLETEDSRLISYLGAEENEKESK